MYDRFYFSFKQLENQRTNSIPNIIEPNRNARFAEITFMLLLNIFIFFKTIHEPYLHEMAFSSEISWWRYTFL